MRARARRYAALATQWEIYDSYMDDQERQRQAKEKGKAKKGAEDKADGSQHGGASVVDDIVHSEGVGHAAKILERMANQNAFDDITQDYKYWEDASDAYRDGEGTLLPLWKFQSDKSKRKHVTSIKWNPSCARAAAQRGFHPAVATRRARRSAPAPPPLPPVATVTTTCSPSVTARTTL